MREPVTDAQLDTLEANLPVLWDHAQRKREELVCCAADALAQLPRLRGRISVDHNGCWSWLRPAANGYGQIRVRGVKLWAHRWVYQGLVGPIPAGLQIDHRCRNRSCVNPAHLRLVTRKDNLLLGIGFAAENAAKTHCPKGHEYAPSNTYVDRFGRRSCRACHNIRDRERRAR